MKRPAPILRAVVHRHGVQLYRRQGTTSLGDHRPHTAADHFTGTLFPHSAFRNSALPADFKFPAS